MVSNSELYTKCNDVYTCILQLHDAYVIVSHVAAYIDKHSSDPNIKQLQEVMIHEDITTKWYELGIELLGTHIPLKEIKANHPNNVWTCCHEMFQKWLEVKPDASWSQLVTALDNIKLHGTADAVSKRYISGNGSLSPNICTKHTCYSL